MFYVRTVAGFVSENGSLRQETRSSTMVHGIFYSSSIYYHREQIHLTEIYAHALHYA